MDFGVLGLEYGAPSPSPSQTQNFLSPESKPKLVGSAFTKQERSPGSADEYHGKSCKLPRTDDLSTPKTMPLHQGTPLLRSNALVSTEACQLDHMINFSLLKSEVPNISKDGSVSETSTQNNDFSYYQHTPSMYTTNAGCGSGSLNASMHGIFSGVEGPFTLSQWNELKHQALIFKYITSNVLVPSNLLVPLKKPLSPYGYLPYDSLGWGSFHLRYTSKTDPEPGRCRRTDGKKWRCSWDAVANKKYCEKHINRGCHRSRKHVEGQTSHAATGTTNSKVVHTSSSESASIKTSGGAAKNLAIPWQHQFKNLQFGAATPPGTLVNRIQDQRGLPVLSSTNNLKSKESTFTITKQGVPFSGSSVSDFGHVAFNTLINPSQSSYCMNFEESSLLIDLTGQETQDQNPPHQSIDAWSKDQSSPSVITWPDELKSYRTQLSMSIPMETSDFSSSSSSPTKDKLDLSSRRLSPEFNPIQMDLGVNTDVNDQTKKQAISWGSSIGGPLGEIGNIIEITKEDRVGVSLTPSRRHICGLPARQTKQLLPLTLLSV
ncbi:hypothetical protein V6N13_126926 [Hibiscus sabdariffa]|uniref:Growth-regulating factor n=1 Tax=Hibiscus sabdariffa TaxID=183260 RepID=A0ABR2RE48_9ROSI